jgi:hypothetical protein
MPFLPFVPFADCAEAVFQFLEQSIPWNLTMGFKFSGPIALADLVTLEGLLDSWWTTYLAGQISALDSLQAIKLTDLTSVTGPTFSAAPSTTPNGTLAGAPLTAQAAMVVTFNTALRGRSYRGRNYVGGRVSPDLLTVTTWAAARVTAMYTAYLNLPSLVGPGGWTQVVLSRYNAGIRRVVGVATPVVRYEAKSQVATQRKRLT